jgi:hypothetical protein
MISLHCTNCNALLEMDDGFAGGVCRCQFCKTIQTVPSKRKESAAAKAGKTAKVGKGLPAGPGGGLDELAEVVASSGLARKSLTKPPAKNGDSGTSQATQPAVKKNPMLLALIAAVLVVVALVGVVVYLVIRPTPDTPGNPAVRPGDDPVVFSGSSGASGGNSKTPAPPVATAGPAFAGVPLPSGPIVYLIDQSQANEEFLDAAKAAAYKSVLSLGSDRKFQIIFWKRESEPIVSYPENGLAPATQTEVTAATKRFEDVVSYGATDLQPTLEKAIAAGPAAIVLTTAKSFFGEENLAVVTGVVKKSPVKIYTFALGESDSPVLKQIAEQTGGEYHAMDRNQLKTLSR